MGKMVMVRRNRCLCVCRGVGGAQRVLIGGVRNGY